MDEKLKETMANIVELVTKKAKTKEEVREYLKVLKGILQTLNISYDDDPENLKELNQLKNIANDYCLSILKGKNKSSSKPYNKPKEDTTTRVVECSRYSSNSIYSRC